MFGKLKLSTQLDVYSLSPENLPVSNCYTSASCLARMLPPKHNSYLRTKVRALTVVIQAHASWLSELYENLTDILHADRGYHVKLQHQEYTEQSMPDNNIHIYIYI